MSKKKRPEEVEIIPDDEEEKSGMPHLDDQRRGQIKKAHKVLFDKEATKREKRKASKEIATTVIELEGHHPDAPDEVIAASMGMEDKGADRISSIRNSAEYQRMVVKAKFKLGTLIFKSAGVLEKILDSKTETNESKLKAADRVAKLLSSVTEKTTNYFTFNNQNASVIFDPKDWAINEAGETYHIPTSKMAESKADVDDICATQGCQFRKQKSNLGGILYHDEKEEDEDDK